MKSLSIAAFAIALFAAPAAAQDSPAASLETPTLEAPARVPVTAEYYYKIRWGATDEFLALYSRNHEPYLAEAKKRGLILDIRTDMPFTHMAGGERWDLRVAITYRDASAAMLTDPEWNAVYQTVDAQVKAGNPKFDEEEARRFSLLDEHWDVLLYPNL